MTKRCARCGETKPVESFSQNAARKDRRGTYCIDCQKEYGRQIAWSQRLEALSHYSGGGDPRCDCCGEENIEFLAIDHIHGGGNKHMKEIGKRLVRWLKKNKYPKGFRVLCHNCNFAIGHYGYCPHKQESIVRQEIETYRSNYKGHGGTRRGLKEEQVAEIKRRINQGETNRSIAKDFPITEDGISKIRRGVSWKDVKPNE